MGPMKLAKVMGIKMPMAVKWAEPLTVAMAKYDINTTKRQAYFLAQIGHESGGLRYTKELWGPTPAQNRYEGRKDLGNIQPGDGKRFMGRGLIQVTGRANYARLSKDLGVDFVSNPDLLELPAVAAESAAQWWKSRGLNEFADHGEFAKITRIINGGYNGLDDRLARLDVAEKGIA